MNVTCVTGRRLAEPLSKKVGVQLPFWLWRVPRDSAEVASAGVLGSAVR